MHFITGWKLASSEARHLDSAWLCFDHVVADFLRIHLCLCLWLRIYMYLSVYYIIYIHLYPSLSICIHLYPSVGLSVCRSVGLSVCRSVGLSVGLSVCLSVCLSIYLPAYVSFLLSIFWIRAIWIHLDQQNETTVRHYLVNFGRMFLLADFGRFCTTHQIYMTLISAIKLPCNAKSSFIALCLAKTTMCFGIRMFDTQNIGPLPDSEEHPLKKKL